MHVMGMPAKQGRFDGGKGLGEANQGHPYKVTYQEAFAGGTGQRWRTHQREEERGQLHGVGVALPVCVCVGVGVCVRRMGQA